MERKALVKQGILDKSLIRPRTEVFNCYQFYYYLFKLIKVVIIYKLLLKVSVSAFAFLFSEFVQYNQNRVSSVPDLEKR